MRRTSPAGPRLAIAVLVAGWTITVGAWQTDADGSVEDVARNPDGYWPCGEIRDFDRSASRASDIEAVGLGCREARRLVRRAHDACGFESCEVEGFECVAEDSETASCERAQVQRVRWTWVGT